MSYGRPLNVTLGGFAFVFGLILFSLAQAMAQTAQPDGAPLAPGGGASLGSPGSPNLRAIEYADPNGVFTIVAPPGVTLQEGDKGEIRMQSPKGYIVTMQKGPTDPALAPKDMAQKLESQYLGPGRPWSVKMGERTISVGGLSAYDALYQGSGTRARAIVARGRAHDFVFLFIAPPRAFETLETEFEWILANFRPAPAERGVTKEHLEKAGRDPKEMDLQTFNQRTVERQAIPSRPIGTDVRRFQLPEFGFTIDYPSDWTAIRPTPFRLVVSGQEGTDAFYATVTVQNVQPNLTGSASQKVASVVADLKAELEQNTRGIKYFGERPFTYDRSGLRLNGRQFLATYSYDNVQFRKWAMVLPRDGGTVLHIWSYTAPEDRFNAYRLIAEGMLRSWTLRPDAVAEP